MDGLNYYLSKTVRITVNNFNTAYYYEGKVTDITPDFLTLLDKKIGTVSVRISNIISIKELNEGRM